MKSGTLRRMTTLDLVDEMEDDKYPSPFARC